MRNRVSTMPEIAAAGYRSAGRVQGRVVAAVLLVITLLVCSAPAQTAGGSQESIRSIFVAPPSNAEATDRAIGAKLIDDLRKKEDVRVAGDAASADAVLHVSAVIWPTGTISMDPRSNSTKITAYQGYLSAELSNRANETLWSYLVTPNRFRMGNIVDDLAGQLSAELSEALKKGIPKMPSSANAGQSAKQGTALSLQAAGGTFPAPLYRKWFESFRLSSGGFAIRYDPVGSVAGMERLSTGAVDFGASDILPDSDPALPHLDVLHFATVVGGVVPIYNLPNTLANNGRPLRLTAQLLADIYLGKIRKWNDPRIREWNRHISLPDTEIAPVHRSDGSGTTYVWTSYLAEGDAEWRAKVAPTVAWPAGVGAAGNEGVAEAVAKTPNSIGYVELTYAIQHQLTYAAVRNAAGEFIRADLASVTAAAAHAESSADGLGLSALNSSAKDAYPISAFTWLLVPKTSSDRTRVATAQFLHWMLTAGQQQCSSLGYAPLPRAIVNEELRAASALGSSAPFPNR